MLVCLTTVSPKTAWHWLQFLDFKYDEVKRCYYIDGHQRSDLGNILTSEIGQRVNKRQKEVGLKQYLSTDAAELLNGNN